MLKLCSMNLDNRTCIQVYDEAPPVFTNSTCTSVATCPPHCLTEANNFKRRLGYCFGTLLRTSSSFSLLASTVSDCNLEPGDLCQLMFSGGITAQSINWLFALLAVLTFALDFN